MIHFLLSSPLINISQKPKERRYSYLHERVLRSLASHTHILVGLIADAGAEAQSANHLTHCAAFSSKTNVGRCQCALVILLLLLQLRYRLHR